LSRQSEPAPGVCAFTYVPALFLLEIVGGLSTVLYDHPSTKSGERYRALLTGYYPWELEPRGGADGSTGPYLLYKAFRNPFAHALGKPDRTIGGLGLMAITFPERELEALELSPTRTPLASRTLDINPDGRPSLHIPGLYWGLLRMIYRLTDDAAMMDAVLPKW
jgi:hypothetical protein